MITPWTIVIFGMSGDLSKRKIIPALYDLYVHQYLGKESIPPFIVIGTGYQETTIDALFEQSALYLHKPKPEIVKKLMDRMTYVACDFSDEASFAHLAEEIVKAEHQYEYPGNRIFYCANFAHFFCTITEKLVSHKLIQPGNPMQRVVYEKPFGSNLSSAHEINQCIMHHLTDEQVYRIDHYLTKEIVTNIVLIRFANILFEPLWSNQYIDHVHILIGEAMGIEGRGNFYDKYGALKDVVQNHLLQLVALVAMDCPSSLKGDGIRDSKAAILQNIRVVSGILGQYEGYIHEKDVAHDSTTETFAALELAIDNPRWKGVPFYIATGKHLDRKATEIHLVFKAERTCFFEKNQDAEPNILIIRVTHEEGFSLRLNSKKPYTRGTAGQTIPVMMDFCYRCLFGPDTPQAYEVLLQEVMAGEQSIAVRWDEIEYQWAVIDTIKNMNLPLYIYAKGTRGPKEAARFMPSYFLPGYAKSDIKKECGV